MTPTIEPIDARSPEAVAAITAYFRELEERFDAGFHDWEAIVDDAGDFDPPGGLFLVVRLGGDVVGCGGVRTLEPGIGEIKRMWIDPVHRGRGLATALLAELEAVVVRLGHHMVRLDTNAVLTEAIRMYERAGYLSIERYNDNPDAERWFEKQLAVGSG